MSISLGWTDILERLVLTLLAGALIGLNRGEHDRPAGLRTTMLVCLAASVSMIQMDLLLGVSGKTSTSFAVMDVMRLPLGILTGVGFIGAGSILKKGDLVRGVTTAATLWYVTVVGLCLGGGQLALGSVTTLLGWVILTLLKQIEKHWNREQQGILFLVSEENGPDPADIEKVVESAGGRVSHWTKIELGRGEEGERRHRCLVRWTDCSGTQKPPPFAEKVFALAGVCHVELNLPV